MSVKSDWEEKYSKSYPKVTESSIQSKPLELSDNEYISSNRNYAGNGEITITKSSDTKPSECDCGAKHTDFPDHHYDWCAAYKERK